MGVLTRWEKVQALLSPISNPKEQSSLVFDWGWRQINYKNNFHVVGAWWIPEPSKLSHQEVMLLRLPVQLRWFVNKIRVAKQEARRNLSKLDSPAAVVAHAGSHVFGRKSLNPCDFQSLTSYLPEGATSSLLLVCFLRLLKHFLLRASFYTDCADFVLATVVGQNLAPLFLGYVAAHSKVSCSSYEHCTIA